MLTYFLFSVFLYLNAPAVLGANYALSEAIIGPAFYDKFIWFYAADPSHGRVNYTDKDTSKRLNLTYASSNSFILRADYKTVLDPSGAGRNSVRIRTNNSYTTHVAVFDVRHMPEGCGYVPFTLFTVYTPDPSAGSRPYEDCIRTWPAIWETKASVWPTGGEVDVLEGVHGKAPNVATLHTTAGCTMPANRTQSGTSASNNCEGGCNVRFPTAQSFGPSFNQNGGGWFALERRTNFIKMWFWHRKSGNVPAFISNPTEKLNTDGWGTPAAFFPNTTCDMTKHFTDHHIIINLTFCGDWAGPAYASSGCPSMCADFVNKNTDYFKDAYFDIAAVRIYKQA